MFLYLHLLAVPCIYIFQVFLCPPFQPVHLPHFRRLPVLHFISWKKPCHMKGNIRIYRGDPFCLLFHFFLRIILSRNDQGGQSHMAGYCASSYKSFHRLQVAAQLPVICLCKSLQVNIHSVYTRRSSSSGSSSGKAIFSPVRT